MRKLKHREIRNLAATITDERHLEDLQWIVDHAQQISDCANSQTDEGYTSPNYDSDGRGGNDSTAVERHLERRTLIDEDGNYIRDRNGDPIVLSDDVYERMTRFIGLMRSIPGAITEARNLAGELVTSKELRDRAAQSGVAANVHRPGCGHCSNCNRWCPGTRDDRLKAGRCYFTEDTSRPNCYDYFRLTGTELPRERWAPTP